MVRERSVRLRLLVAAALLVPAAGARAGHVEARSDGTTVIHVKVWQLPDPSRTDTFTRAEVAGVKAFIRRFPEIFAEKYAAEYKANPDKFGDYNWDKVAIELQQFSGIRVEGVETDLLAIAGRVAPDVLYVNFRKSDNYIQNSFLYPLDKPEDNYLTGMTKEEVDFRIHRKIWPVIWRRGPGGSDANTIGLADGTELSFPQCRGRVWAIPFGGAIGKVLLYRKDLFDEHRIPYPDTGWTWEDLYAAAKKITDPQRGIYGMQLGRGKHESWYWVTFLWSAGADVMVHDPETDRWRCVFDTRQAARALDFYTRLSAEKWIDEDGKVRRGYAYKEQEAWNKWDRGEIAMRFDYIDGKVFSKINPELTGMAPVPLGPPGPDGKRVRGGELNSRMMGLFAGIDNPVVRDAAWEYMRFYDSREAVRIKTRIMVEGGLGRFLNPKYLRMFGYPEVIRLAPKGWSDTFEIAIETGKPEPYGRNSNYAYDLMTSPIQQAEQMALGGELPEDPNERLDVLHGLLKRANARANEEMIGIISPEERTRRDIVASIVLAGIVIAFGFVFRFIIRKFTPPEALIGKKVRWGFWRYRWAYLLMLPAVLTILVWRYIPLARGSVMAFQDYRLMGESSWVWVQNFGDLLWDMEWWRAVWNSIRYCFLVMTTTFLPPIILAVLLQEVPRGKMLFRSIYYLPAVTGGLVLMIMWKQFYDPSENGVLNAIVMSIPAVGFVALGTVLAVVAWLFVRRMLYHDLNVQAALFATGGVVLFLTFAGLAWPIIFRGGRGLWEVLGALLASSLAEAVGPTGSPGLDTAMRWTPLILVLIVALALAWWLWRAVRHRFVDRPRLKVGLIVAGVVAIVIAYIVFARPALPKVLPVGGLGVWLARLPGRLIGTLPEPFRWRGDPDTAMLTVVIPMIWAGMGPGCLIYLAALKGISDDFYEAADLDGATFIDKVLFVVFPILRPLILINFLGVFIASFYGSTAMIMVMTGGGADTETAGLHIFYKAFIFLKIGPATARAWVLAAMLIGFTVYQLRILSRLEFRTTGKKE